MALRANYSAYCLNLARRPDRRIQAWFQFRREGLGVQRIIAPDALPVEQARGWRNKGARACAAAHRLAWREVRKTDVECVIVFEDDVVLCRGFRERLESLPVPEDWKMIYLGCIFRDVPEPVAPGVVRVRGRTWATHALVLRAEVLPELHRLLAPWSRRRNGPKPPSGKDGEAIDDLLCGLHARWPVYAVYPFLAWQSPGVSTIEGYHRTVWDREGRQLACPEVAARLDALLGLPARITSGSAKPKVANKPAPLPPPTQVSPVPKSRPYPATRIAHPAFPARPARLQTLPIYGLNLDRRPDRRLLAWQQFRRQRLDVVRLRAPDAAGVSDARGWLLKGYRACAAAHRLAFRAARKAGAPGVIIFEDDVVLCEDFRERFAALELPDDWGLFFFGCVFEPPGPELLPGGLLRVQGGTFDNHAYAVRAELAGWSRPVRGSEM